MIKELGLAALLFLSPLKVTPDDFESQYGKLMWMSVNGNYLGFGYDTDDDGKEDLRNIYEVIGKDDDFVYFELRERWEDVNRNGLFEDDEITKIEVEQDSVNVSF